MNAISMCVTTRVLLFLALAAGIVSCGGSNGDSVAESAGPNQSGGESITPLDDPSTIPNDFDGTSSDNADGTCGHDMEAVTDLVDPGSESNPGQFVSVNGDLFFVAYARTGVGLYRYDAEIGAVIELRSGLVANFSNQGYPHDAIKIVGSTDNEVMFVVMGSPNNLWKPNSSTFVPDLVLTDQTEIAVIGAETDGFLFGVPRFDDQSNQIIRYSKTGGEPVTIVDLDGEGFRRPKIKDMAAVENQLFFYSEVGAVDGDKGIFKVDLAGQSVKILDVKVAAGRLLAENRKIYFSEGFAFGSENSHQRNIVVLDSSSANVERIAILSENNRVPDITPVPQSVANGVVLFYATGVRPDCESCEIERQKLWRLSTGTVPNAKTMDSGPFSGGWKLLDDGHYYGEGRISLDEGTQAILPQIARLRTDTYNFEKVNNFQDQDSLGVYSGSAFNNIIMIDQQVYFTYVDVDRGGEVWRVSACGGWYKR